MTTSGLPPGHSLLSDEVHKLFSDAGAATEVRDIVYTDGAGNVILVSQVRSSGGGTAVDGATADRLRADGQFDVRRANVRGREAVLTSGVAPGQRDGLIRVDWTEVDGLNMSVTGRGSGVTYETLVSVAAGMGTNR